MALTRGKLNIGRDPFNQNFRKFRFKTQWIGSVQPEKFRKNGSTGPVGTLVEWMVPIKYLKRSENNRDAS